MSNKSWFHCVWVKHSSSSSSSSSDSSSSSSSESEDEVNPDRIQDQRPCVTQTKTFYRKQHYNVCFYFQDEKKMKKKRKRKKSSARKGPNTSEEESDAESKVWWGKEKKKSNFICALKFKILRYFYSQEEKEKNKGWWREGKGDFHSITLTLVSEVLKC